MKKLMLALSLAAALPAGAVRQGPLPDFEVRTPEAAAVPSSDLAMEGRWLLVYAVPGSPACRKLFQALSSMEGVPLAARARLLVRAPTPEAAAYVKSVLPPSVAIPWYADGDDAAWKALGLSGAPVLVGMRGSEVAWTLSGVLNDPSAFDSVIRSWIGEPLPKNR